MTQRLRLSGRVFRCFHGKFLFRSRDVVSYGRMPPSLLAFQEKVYIIMFILIYEHYPKTFSFFPDASLLPYIFMHAGMLMCKHMYDDLKNVEMHNGVQIRRDKSLTLGHSMTWIRQYNSSVSPYKHPKMCSYHNYVLQSVWRVCINNYFVLSFYYIFSI